MMRTGRLRNIMFIALLVLIWTIITLFTDWIDPIFLPSPVAIFKSIYNMRDTLLESILMSLSIALSGFGLGTCIGVGVGLLMAYSKGFMDTVGPCLEFLRPVPIFALIPLLLLWFGIGMAPQLALVALGVVAILGVSTYEAVKNIPSIFIRAASNLGADKKTIFRTIIAPYIVPHLIGAIRVAAASAWGLDVAAEFMSAQSGLGYLMIMQQTYLNTAGIIALVMIYGMLAICLDNIIRIIELKLTGWTERSKNYFEKI